MTTPEVTQIRVCGQRTGIIGLKEVIESVAAECAGEGDEVIKGELLDRLSKNNYMSPNVMDKYGTAFLLEYKKFVGEPFEEPLGLGFVEVKVLGPGCPNCERLEQDLMTLMAELKLQADLEHVRDPVAIREFGVFGLPGLVINGNIKAVGNVPSKARLREWLLQAVGK